MPEASSSSSFGVIQLAQVHDPITMFMRHRSKLRNQSGTSHGTSSATIFYGSTSTFRTYCPKKDPRSCDIANVLQLDEEEGDDTQAAPPPQAEGSETLPAQVPVRQLPAKMFRPMVDWPIRYGGPPFALNLEAEFKIPADDERLATPAAVDRALQIARQAAVRYPHPSMIPATPAEAPAEAPMASSPRRIPLEHTPTLQPAAADQMQMPSAAQPAPAQQPLPGAVHISLALSLHPLEETTSSISIESNLRHDLWIAVCVSRTIHRRWSACRILLSLYPNCHCAYALCHQDL